MASAVVEDVGADVVVRERVEELVVDVLEVVDVSDEREVIEASLLVVLGSAITVARSGRSRGPVSRPDKPSFRRGIVVWALIKPKKRPYKATMHSNERKEAILATNWNPNRKSDELRTQNKRVYYRTTADKEYKSAYVRDGEQL